jgi:hypothetical protein
MTEADYEKFEKLLQDAHQKWIDWFKEYGFEFAEGKMMSHESNIAFARVVEHESKSGRITVDFPMARKMFMLGWLTGKIALSKALADLEQP